MGVDLYSLDVVCRRRGSEGDQRYQKRGRKEKRRKRDPCVESEAAGRSAPAAKVVDHGADETGNKSLRRSETDNVGLK